MLNSHVNQITAAKNGNEATGWKINASAAYSSTKKRSNHGYWQKRCSNGDKNWWGWCDGNCGTGTNGLAIIETTLKGCGTARLDFGNCYTYQCQVSVHVDGKIISTAYQNTPHKVVQFDFQEGSELKITEGPNFCMMSFNSFEVISCKECQKGMINLLFLYNSKRVFIKFEAHILKFIFINKIPC